MALILRMHDHAIAHIQCYVTVIAYYISGTCFIERSDRGSYTAVRYIVVRKTETEVSVNCHDKSGTVCAMGQAGTTPYIRISDKLCGKFNNCLPGLCTGLAHCHLGYVRLCSCRICSAKSDLNDSHRCLFILGSGNIRSGLGELNNCIGFLSLTLFMICPFLDIGIADAFDFFLGRLCNGPAIRLRSR